MDEESRELCFKDISNDVLDSDKMVSISMLSENWSMSMRESSETLEKWIKSCGKDKEFVKFLLVRGTQKDGMPFMTITSEDKLASLKAKSDKVFQMLYSIKLGTEPPAIITPTLLDGKKKRIQLTNLGSCRESQDTVPAVDIKAETSTKQESSRPSFSFGTSSKDTKTQPPANKFFKAEPKTPAKETTVASISPKKKTPLKKEAPKKNGSIGSFFSAKPSVKKEKSTSPSSDKENKTESSEEIPVSKNSSQSTNSESSNGKRGSISNDPSDKEKDNAEDVDNPAKRRKVDSAKKKARAKGSRIMLMEDSDEENEASKEPDNDVEMEEPEPTEPETKQTNGNAEPKEPPKEPGRRGRVKKRRVVTRTYEDEDGFMKTVKETEMYSTDDDCDVIEEKTNKVEVKSPNGDIKAKETKAKSTKAAAKPTTTKQGSIMSFFSKK